MSISKKLTLSVGLLISLGFIWGSGYSIAKFATENGVSPLGYSFWQSIGPALLLCLIALFEKSPLKFDRAHVPYYAVCGLLGIALPNSNMYFAAPHLPAGILAVIVNIVPIIIYPIALAAKQEQFDGMRFLAVLIGVAGILFIVLPHSSLPDPAMIPWASVTLLTPFSFAICAVYVANNRPADSDSLSLAAGMLLASALFLAPIVISTGNFYMFHFPLTLPDYIVLLEIILSSIGYVVFFKLLKIAGSVYYSLVGGIVAITGIFWGHVIFNEHLNRWNIVSVLLILLAIIVMSWRQNKITR